MKAEVETVFRWYHVAWLPGKHGLSIATNQSAQVDELEAVLSIIIAHPSISRPEDPKDKACRARPA